MENKKSIFTGSVIASAIIGLSSLTASAASISNYSSLGTGGDVRSELLTTSSSVGFSELACGEKKTKEAKCGEKGKKKGKAKEAKCGEGKCGEGKKKKPM